MHSAAKYASSPARSASLVAPSIRPLGSRAALMIALGSRLTMGLSSLGTDQAGKVARSPGVMQARGMPTRTGLKLFVILPGNAPLADHPVSSIAASSLHAVQR